MSSEKLPPERRPPASAADAAERLARIVDAAERAAASVIDDAEEQARQRVEEARARADQIAAERLRQLADQLDPPQSAGGPEHRLRPVEADPTREGSGQRRQTGEPDLAAVRPTGSAGARLLATQMAVSGASRKEIEARLRSGFDIQDASEILDAILGPEG